MKQILFQKLPIRKLTLLLAVSLFTNLALHAQAIKVGARAGVSLSNWNLSNVEYISNSSLVNPDFALLADLSISKTFSIQPEIIYAVYGTKLKYQGDYTMKVRNDYLLIPVLAKYRMPNGLALLAGPQIGFLLNAETKDSDGQKQDIKGMLKKNDFMVVAGLEYEFQNGLSFSARYNAGLSNIYDVELQGAKVKNAAFGFGVGYKLSAGRWK